MKNIFIHWFTGIDGETYDPARFLGFAAVMSYLAWATYAIVWSKQAFEPISYATGVAAALAGYSAGVVIKKSTEPTS